jgi:predicted dehydrogenase
MRLAFIGGCGHHYLAAALGDPVTAGNIERPVAMAGDGVDEAAARRFAAGLGDFQWFDDAERMFDSFAPDTVSVGAVYGHNSRFVAAALRRGIKVVSDKPIAASWEALREIQSLATHGTLLTELPFRAQLEFRAAREAVRQGLIGDVVLATAQKSYRFGVRPDWYSRREDYGGTLLWVASHGIDAIAFVSGRRLLTAFGHQGNVSRPQFGTMEDHTVSIFELEGGGTGVVHADYLRPKSAATHGDDRVRIAGSLGVVEVRDDRCRLMTMDQSERDITDSVTVRAVHQELLAALRDETNEFYSTTASLELASTLLRARDAADSGRVVTIGEK